MSCVPIQTLAAKRGGNRVLQLMRCGDAARAANILVKIVDPAVIDQTPVGTKYGNFRRNLDLTLLYKHMLRIAQRWNLVTVLALVLADHFRGFRLARINQPERRLRRMCFT